MHDVYFVGVPVAWAILDREEVPIFQQFFRCVRNNVPDAIVKTLMTDDGILLLNNYTGMKFSINVFHILYIDPALPVAFEQEFMGIRHLLCIWHVDRYIIAMEDNCFIITLYTEHGKGNYMQSFAMLTEGQSSTNIFIC